MNNYTEAFVKKIKSLLEQYNFSNASQLAYEGIISENDYLNYSIDILDEGKKRDILAGSTCQSPLEERFLILVKSFIGEFSNVYFIDNIKITSMRADWGNYKVDFIAFYYDSENKSLKPMFIVELDSDEYHHTNVNQVYKDKERDQIIIAQMGLPIIRFTFSDVFKNPGYCRSILIETIQTIIDGHYKHYEAYDPLNRIKHNEKDVRRIIEGLKSNPGTGWKL
jgi:very-short-patch-repair endonuclease